MPKPSVTCTMLSNNGHDICNGEAVAEFETVSPNDVSAWFPMCDYHLNQVRHQEAIAGESYGKRRPLIGATPRKEFKQADKPIGGTRRERGRKTSEERYADVAHELDKAIRNKR